MTKRAGGNASRDFGIEFGDRMPRIGSLHEVAPPPLADREFFGFAARGALKYRAARPT